MVQNTISFNIHAQGGGVVNPNRLLRWHRENRPNWSLVMDNLGYALDIADASPATNVIHRDYTPDGAWFNHTPEDYLKWQKARFAGLNANLWGYVDNEAGVRPDWYIELIEKNKSYKQHIVIGNWSVGTPEPKDFNDPQVRRLLELTAEQREYIVLGLHEYGHGQLTSGYQDQHYWPYNGSWPTSVAPQHNNFHVGRYKFLVDKFPKLPIRMVITEHGWDTLRDMVWWYPKSKGWQDAADIWRQMWGSDVNVVQTALQQLEYANNVIYRYTNNVEGQLLFTYGHVGDNWFKHDTERLGEEFLQGLTKINTAGTVPIPPVITPPIVLPPVVEDEGDTARLIKELQSVLDKYKAKLV